MILFPAIDIKNGQAVRLLRGEMSTAVVFNENPAEQALAFERAGFDWLHLVDLDGAFAGSPVNDRAIEGILASVSLRTQLGGGVRDLATVERWLRAGVTRIILGTAAVNNPNLVREACRQFPDRIAVALDARGVQVAIEGWSNRTEIAAIDIVRKLEDAGVAALIYTDIERDGMLAGVNFEATCRLAENTAIPVIASGGIGSLDDIARLMRLQEMGIVGAICGRAFYDGRIHPADALRLIQSQSQKNC